MTCAMSDDARREAIDLIVSMRDDIGAIRRSLEDCSKTVASMRDEMGAWQDLFSNSKLFAGPTSANSLRFDAAATALRARFAKLELAQ